MCVCVYTNIQATNKTEHMIYNERKIQIRTYVQKYLLAAYNTCTHIYTAPN